MIRLLTVLLFSLLIGDIFGDEITGMEVSQEYIEELQLEEIEPENCPGVEGCLHSCLLGRKRDDEGCKTCECKEKGRWEGDILVSKSDYRRLKEVYRKNVPMTSQYQRQKRGAMSLKETEWPRRGDTIEIPYTFTSSITGLKRQRIMEAIDEYRSRTCLRFVPRYTQRDYIEFTGAGDCSSHIGKIGEKQPIHIGENCENTLGTVIHEMMHAVGFWHEQSRGDRDDYVDIMWENVAEYAKNNFQKQEMYWNSYGSNYDLESVMHYGGEYFTNKRGQPTIVDKRTGQPTVGQRINFSPEDVRQINLKYQCTSYLNTNKPDEVPDSTNEVVCKDDLSASRCRVYYVSGYCKYRYFYDRCKVTCKACVPTETPKPTPAPTTEAPQCEDNSGYSYCLLLKSRGLCRTQKKAMEKICMKTCGFCDNRSRPSICRDTTSQCGIWARNNNCFISTYRRFLEKACKRSCGYCTGY